MGKEQAEILALKKENKTLKENFKNAQDFIRNELDDTYINIYNKYIKQGGLNGKNIRS